MPSELTVAKEAVFPSSFLAAAPILARDEKLVYLRPFRQAGAKAFIADILLVALSCLVPVC